MTDAATTYNLEREAFKTKHKHLDLDEDRDAWDRPKFKHSHVDAMWAGWWERAKNERGIAA